jgi:hypothetical protein
MTNAAEISLQLAAGLVVGGLAGLAWLRSLRWTVGLVLEGRSMLLTLGGQMGRFLALALVLTAMAKWFGAAGLGSALVGLTISKRLATGPNGGRQ